MLQDPNVERVIKNYTEPLQKQISMMQIELEALKKQSNIGVVSGHVPEDIQTFLHRLRIAEHPEIRKEAIALLERHCR
jgi:hypothetical protein